MADTRCTCALASLLLAALLLGGCSRPANSPDAAPPAALPSRAASGSASTAGAPELVVHGEVLIASKVPEPGSAPYKECLTLVKYRVLSVEQGKYDAPELLAAHWGMKENKLMPAARYRVGEQHRLILEPLSKHPELERVMQADDTNEYDLTPYWVVGE